MLDGKIKVEKVKNEQVEILLLSFALLLLVAGFSKISKAPSHSEITFEQSMPSTIQNFNSPEIGE